MRTRTQRGFTLVEMIVVIVITGIIAGMVAMFIRAPVQGYVDSSRRAEMSDIADTALRRLARDLRTAVPNSVRLPAPAGSSYIEFLPTKDGGRYRVANVGAGGCGATGNELSFGTPDTCFEVIGSQIAFNANDAIVIGSTQSDGNLPYLATTAASSVRATVTASGLSGTTEFVTFGSKTFPVFAELPGSRFEVVPNNQQAVTYACVGTLNTLDANQDGQAQLLRISNYGFNAAQSLPATAGAPVLADKVSDCSFVYDTSNQRNSLVAVTLTITRGGDSVRLYHEIHVNNIP
jgi:MSHA biogenesis protein MshO